MLCTRWASGEIGRRGFTRELSRIRPVVSTTATSHTPPGRSVVSQSMTTARRGVSMVRAQVTAWSERRTQAGAAVVIIGIPPPVGVALRWWASVEPTTPTPTAMRRYSGAWRGRYRFLSNPQVGDQESFIGTVPRAQAGSESVSYTH